MSTLEVWIGFKDHHWKLILENVADYHFNHDSLNVHLEDGTNYTVLKSKLVYIKEVNSTADLNDNDDGGINVDSD